MGDRSGLPGDPPGVGGPLRGPGGGQAVNAVQTRELTKRFGSFTAVDRLSLYLSLAQNPDERVRLAANALLEGMSW